MKEVRKNIHISHLINNFKNPRHKEAKDEKDALVQLFNSVKFDHMFNLAEDIQKKGLHKNKSLTCVFDEKLNKYVVYDGNRRLAAILLLLDTDKFDFLTEEQIRKVNKLKAKGLDKVSRYIDCLITDRESAMLLMNSEHIGEDEGRGRKDWGAKEKENFKKLQGKSSSIASIITDKVLDRYNINLEKDYLPFTTIGRIFGQPDVYKEIGLNKKEEKTFTDDKLRLVIEIVKWVKKHSEKLKKTPTRMLNSAQDTIDIVLPVIKIFITSQLPKCQEKLFEKSSSEAMSLTNDIKQDDHENASVIPKQQVLDVFEDHTKSNPNISVLKNQEEIPKLGVTLTATKVKNQKVKPPFFFEGLDISGLNRKDQKHYGLLTVCQELKKLSKNEVVVKEYSLYAIFLIRALIEQTLYHYSENKIINNNGKKIKIIEDIRANKGLRDDKKYINLGTVLKLYNQNLEKYIDDKEARDYFLKLFGNNEQVQIVDELNWTIHRIGNYQIPLDFLLDYPRQGLLYLVNYLISYREV